MGKKVLPMMGAPKDIEAEPQSTQCVSCEKVIKDGDKALFVENELGRRFCSEECILSYFSPEIDRLETQFNQNRPEDDFTEAKRADLNHLKWTTLDQPDEIWCEKTLAGDYRYTLISEYELEGAPIWSVAVSLFLNGEPSFLFIAFPTKFESMAEVFRKGERIEVQKFKSTKEKSAPQEETKLITPEGVKDFTPYDGLAEPWTDDETLTAELRTKRKKHDIPEADFELYEDCVEETLQKPNEIWKSQKLYHFIKHFEESKDAEFWYIVAAIETDEEDQLEILDQFPTQDLDLIEAYRIGVQKSLESIEEEDERVMEGPEEEAAPMIH